jgi:hypothetical protein
MARTVQSIEQDIQLLDQTVETIAQDMHDAYKDYINVLGDALRKQLVIACYHLCTQGYPEKFLERSLSERQSLQQNLRELGQRSQEQLLELVHPPRPVSKRRTEQPSLLEALMSVAARQQLERMTEGTDPDVDESSETVLGEDIILPSDGANDTHDSTEVLLPQSAPSINELTEAIAAAQESDDEDEDEAEDRPINPYDLVHWRDDLEDEIAELLQSVSHDTNKLLQEAGILPRALPEPVLEVASKADMMAESVGPPNLLKLRIEAETDDQEELETAHLVVVHLRLSEIEFSNPDFSSKRATIRELSAKLSQLGRSYRRVHREKAVAEAESAWRSSWFED